MQVASPPGLGKVLLYCRLHVPLQGPGGQGLVEGIASGMESPNWGSLYLNQENVNVCVSLVHSSGWHLTSLHPLPCLNF